MSNVTEHPPSPPTAPLAARPPTGPHPNFWWSALWCVFMLLVTQIPAALAAVGLLAWVALRAPDDLENWFGAAMLLAIVVAHGLIVLLSLLVLRVTSGRQWTSRIALRLPSLAHLLLALAMAPAFLVLGNGLDGLLERVHYPSVSPPKGEAKADGQPTVRVPPLGAFWGAVVAVVLATGMGQLLCRIVGGRDWAEKWIAPLSDGAKTVGSVLLLAVVVGAGVGTYHLLLPAMADLLPETTEMAGVGDLVKGIGSMPLSVAIAVIGLFPALSEELWCRAFLGRGLVGKYGVVWGVLFSSFFFGAIHGDPRQATYAACMGVVLHATYLLSRSLLVPMLLHFANNGATVALLRVPAVKGMVEDAELVPWHLYAAAGALLTACLLAFWQSRARLMGLWRPEHPGVAVPSAGSGTAVVAPMPTWWAAVLVAMALVAIAGSLGVALR